eukprot:SAG31_NODE_5002_length_2807_cov_33.203471_1_plen_97_part_00
MNMPLSYIMYRVLEYALQYIHVNVHGIRASSAAPRAAPNMPLLSIVRPRILHYIIINMACIWYMYHTLTCTRVVRGPGRPRAPRDSDPPIRHQSRY